MRPQEYVAALVVLVALAAVVVGLVALLVVLVRRQGPPAGPR